MRCKVEMLLHRVQMQEKTSPGSTKY
uniref:Uncharacterized protein n=1 Tax=Arundo donax TaxID=35708 RepID=A0A0A9S8X3_ARUDO